MITREELSSSLREHLDNVDSQLDKIDNYQLNQTIKLTEFYKKLMENSAVSITCRGDSITYGQDTTSIDKRPADTTATTNGTSHTFTRASKTYPERLGEIINSQYGHSCNVINWGYSGDGPKQGLTHYPNPSGSDLCIIMYGTNNATLTSLEDYNNVESFIVNYEKIIKLELENNTPILIIKPHKTKYPDAKTDRFVNSLNILAEKYGIPVIDLEREMANYNQDIYSDGIHYNSVGYKLIASKIATFILGGFGKVKVQNGTTLLTRKSIDGCLSNGNYDSIDYVQTPREMNSTRGIGIYLGTGKSITYYFETLEDDLICVPNFISYGGTANVKYEIDYLEQLQEKSIVANSQYIALCNTESKVIAHNISNRFIDGIHPKLKAYIPVKGIHSITVTTSDSAIYFEGLSFISYNDFFKYNNKPIGYYDGKLYDRYSTSPSSISETRISEEALRCVFNSNLIGADYFQAVPMKLTVVSTDRGLIEYGFLQVATGEKHSTGGGMRFIGELSRKEFISSPSLRTVTNITFDNITREYVITWGGSTNALGKFIITPM